MMSYKREKLLKQGLNLIDKKRERKFLMIFPIKCFKIPSPKYLQANMSVRQFYNFHFSFQFVNSNLNPDSHLFRTKQLIHTSDLDIKKNCCVISKAEQILKQEEIKQLLMIPNKVFIVSRNTKAKKGVKT